ncbi:MAG: hypothetical protein GWN00_12755, partial [Aliifodinibius sp.]|nr:hypothetical protein [Fodinibius sp.]NIV11997.1 hypothetical protein [Fodinibius sp.]NIY25643.1 hypothetical protein [Fodinibius sp.]
MKRIYTAVLVLAVLMLTVVGFAQQKATVKNASFYDYSMTSLAGETL